MEQVCIFVGRGEPTVDQEEVNTWLRKKGDSIRITRVLSDAPTRVTAQIITIFYEEL